MTSSNLVHIVVSKDLREKISLEAFNPLEVNHHERDILITLSYLEDM